MGDCIAATPTLALLRKWAPGGEISVLAEPYSAPVLRHNPNLDNLIELGPHSGRMRFMLGIMRLRANRYDLLMDVQGSGRSRLETSLLRSQRKVGFDKKHWLANVMYTDLVPYDTDVHAVRRMAQGLAPLGITPSDGQLRTEVFITEDGSNQADRLLAAHGVRGPFAFLQATSAQRPSNRVWQESRFARVAEHLWGRGIQVVTSTDRDHEKLRRICAQAKCPIVDFSGHTPTLVLAALIKSASLFVGYNTGPMHMAGAMDTPIVCFCDKRADLVEWHPWTSAPHRVLQARAQPDEKEWSTDSISVEEVCGAIDGLISLGRARAPRVASVR